MLSSLGRGRELSALLSMADWRNKGYLTSRGTDLGEFTEPRYVKCQYTISYILQWEHYWTKGTGGRHGPVSLKTKYQRHASLVTTLR